MSTTPGYGSTPQGPISEGAQPEWLAKAETDGLDASQQASGYLHPSDAPAPAEPLQGYGQPGYAQQPQASYPQGYAAQSPYSQQYPQPGYPQPYAAGQWVPVDPNAKSRVAAGLLGIFLGSLGIHRFYLGYTGIGLTMLLITVLTFGIGAIVTSIWGLVEGILYLTDKTGNYSRDATGRPLQG